MFMALMIGFSALTFMRVLRAVITGNTDQADIWIVLFIAGNFLLILAQRGFSH